ncbi:MAG: hypothetical protein WA734_20175 [Candidatus Acidiferrales bacterium]
MKSEKGGAGLGNIGHEVIRAEIGRKTPTRCRRYDDELAWFDHFSLIETWAAHRGGSC